MADSSISLGMTIPKSPLLGIEMIDATTDCVILSAPTLCVVQSADRVTIKSSIRASPGKASAFDAVVSV